MSLKYFLLIIPTALSAATVSNASELETAIITANGGGDSSITFTSDIAYSQYFRPLGCDSSFSLVDEITLTIDGDGNTLSTSGNFRGFIAAGEPTNSTGTITIQNLTISGAKAVGGTTGSGGGGGGAGLGGGLFVGKNTNIVIDNVTFSSCSAEGGDAFSFNGTTGGAGGMHGNGARNPLGGGGGFLGTAAQGSSGVYAGGGGGAGTNASTSTGGGDFAGSTANPTGKGGNGSIGGIGESGTYGGGGGAGINGGDGGWGGGGGGGSDQGGNGGFGGGGAGGGQSDQAGNGGFGGGGGGGFNSSPGIGGFGGGDGAPTYGGGGAAMGGAIFIEDGGSLTINSASFSGSSLTAGVSGRFSEPAETYGTDIFLMSGGNLTFNNSADMTISNPIESDEGAGGGSSGTLTMQGSGKLTLPSGCSFDGNLVLSGGTLSASADSCLGSSSVDPQFNGGTLEVTSSFSSSRDISVNEGNGTLLIAADQTLTHSGTLSGTGTLTKSGTGKLTVTGSSLGYSGAITVTAGTLAMNGTVGSTITTQSSGVVQGSGTCGGLDVYGTLSPGNSIDTINVNGDYTQQADSTLQIEIDPTDNDKIIATGAANLAGTLEILPLAGSYEEGTIYTIIEAASINGTFDTITEDHPLDFVVGYTSSTVTITIPLPQVLTVVPLTSLTGNERAVANYIFCPRFSSTDPDMVAMRNALGSLVSGPFQNSLLNLTPVQYVAFPIATSTVFSGISENLTTPLRDCYKRGSHFTVAPLYMHNKFDPLGQQYPFTSNTGGAAVEYGYTFSSGFQSDARFTYSYSRIEWEKGVGSGRFDMVSLGARLGYSSPTTSFCFAPSYFLTTNTIDRSITIGTTERTATGNFLGNGLGGHIDCFHKQLLGKNKEHCTYLAPTASIDAISIWQNRSKEEGASSLDLHVKGKTYGTLIPKASLVLGTSYQMPKMITFSPSIGVGYSGFIFLNSNTLYASMPAVVGCGRSFQTSLYNSTLNRWNIACKADFTRCNMKFLTLAYDIESNKRLTTQKVVAELQWAF